VKKNIRDSKSTAEGGKTCPRQKGHTSKPRRRQMQQNQDNCEYSRVDQNTIAQTFVNDLTVHLKSFLSISMA
jgi:hypothetical protein